MMSSFRSKVMVRTFKNATVQSLPSSDIVGRKHPCPWVCLDIESKVLTGAKTSWSGPCCVKAKGGGVLNAAAVSYQLKAF